MNPYEANPSKIPSTDRYIQEPSYGRYLPSQEDFQPDPIYTKNLLSPETTSYWSPVLSSCNETHRIYENEEGCRDVFAFGGVIIKSTHLQRLREDDSEDEGVVERDYSFADANEVEAIALTRGVLGDVGVRVPRVYFAGKVAFSALFLRFCLVIVMRVESSMIGNTC